MFGEYESESPRVPSPWDSLISSPRSISPSKSACQSNNNLTTTTTTTTTNSTPHSSPLRYPSTPSPPLLLPRLVPENDSGNVEYKLQLLNPSCSRFTRLVTQLKWRLLEGGGQAYYELGVADSGDLVGLGRAELESSLDTLEMMAGEIGASVIVVKEIEVPAELASRYEDDARNSGKLNSFLGDARGKRSRRRDRGLLNLDFEEDAESVDISVFTNTETEEESGVTDDDMQMTIVLEGVMDSSDHRRAMADLTDAMSMFAMDSELDSSDPAETVDTSEIDDDRLILPLPQYAVDLEISSVYKPRPMRKRFPHPKPGQPHHHHSNGQQRSAGKRGKKGNEKGHLHHDHQAQDKYLTVADKASVPAKKSLTRRQARDRRREERKQTLLTLAARGVVEAPDGNPTPADEATQSLHSNPTDNADPVQVGGDSLVEELETLHVGVGQSVSVSKVPESIATSPPIGTDVDNTTTSSAVMAVVNNSDSPQTVDVNCEDEDDTDVFIPPVVATPKLSEMEENIKADIKLIVEVLVVRKMSIEEGFLDFEGFSFI